MKASELIGKLQEMIDMHGDMAVRHCNDTDAPEVKEVNLYDDLEYGEVFLIE